MNDIEWEVSVCNNKYTIRFHKNGKLSFLRHDDDWEVANREFQFSGLILAMAQEIYELRNNVKLHGSIIIKKE
jgi:hypothetical protein